MTTRDGGSRRWLRALIALVVIAVVIYALFFYVFPWVDRNLLNDPTLEASASSSAL